MKQSNESFTFPTGKIIFLSNLFSDTTLSTVQTEPLATAEASEIYIKCIPEKPNIPRPSLLFVLKDSTMYIILACVLRLNSSARRLRS